MVISKFAFSFSAKLAAVNLSVSGPAQYSAACDSSSAQTYGIKLLLSINVATVIATGNDGSTNLIGSPSCISLAVSVASSTKQDRISGFSNIADIVTLIAPGGDGSGTTNDVWSSIPTNAYAYLGGTSMAAPHVTGAFAAMMSARPNASVQTLVKAMTSSGIPITDNQRKGGTVTKPRIRVDLALAAIPPTALVVTPPNDTAITVPQGSPSTSFQYKVSGSNGPVGYTASISDFPWVTFTPPSGTAPAGEQSSSEFCSKSRRSGPLSLCRTNRVSQYD